MNSPGHGDDQTGTKVICGTTYPDRQINSAMATSPRRRRPQNPNAIGMNTFKRILGRAVLAAVAALLLAAAVLTSVGLTDRLAYADAAVVPGNTVHEDGTPSSRLRARLDAALQMYGEGRCKVIVVSGATGVEGWDEAAVMKDYLVQQGVPPDRVLQDSRGVDTAATARNTALLLRQRGHHSVIAVSQFFHVPRLRMLLAGEGLAVEGYVHADHFELRDGYATLREVAAISTLVLTTIGSPPQP
jgi:vancomycin permeability regulator SanA